MFIRPCYKKSNGKKLAYWALVESYRTPQGPRQRIVAYLGQLKEAQRQGIKRAAGGKNKPQFVQTQLFDNEQLEVEWVEINVNGVRVENEKDFGGPWLALELIKLFGLDEFLKRYLPSGEEHVPWSLVSLMHERFTLRLEKELEKIRTSCEKRKCKKGVIDRRIGRIKTKNSRGAGLFDIVVTENDGCAVISWTKKESWREWVSLSEGC